MTTPQSEWLRPGDVIVVYRDGVRLGEFRVGRVNTSLSDRSAVIRDR